MNKIEIPLCLECKHFYKNEYEEFCCKVYPEGIPNKILEGKKDRRRKRLKFKKKRKESKRNERVFRYFKKTS